MPGLFVTATGTEVGKTFVTGGLLRAGRREGIAMHALKPILSGYEPAQAETSDAGVLLHSLDRPVDDASIASIAPWRFTAPLSPDMAAEVEGRSIDFAALVAACHTALGAEQLTLIEGVGGVMVPIDGTHTILDLIHALQLPVLLVSATHLGSISHCLTAVAALRSKDLSPLAVVLNESDGSSVPMAATHKTLAAFLRETPIRELPRDAGAAAFDRLFQDLLSLDATLRPGS